MICILDGEDITNRQFRTENGTTYPFNWCQLSTQEDREAIGIITLTEVYPEVSEGYYISDEYVDDMENLTRTYILYPIE